nr:unnamed protein product [Callosobruchus analis]
MLSRKEANKIMSNAVSESESNSARSRRGSKVRVTGRNSTDQEARLDRVENMILAIPEKLSSKERDTEIDFRPLTKEQEPPIPTAKPNILQQSRECQRLGTTSFNNIRYAEVHKKLHASPVFSSLKVNPQLPPTLSLNQLQDQLAKTDSYLGTILHGMLPQREAFSNKISEIIRKHPGARSDIFNIRMYVCGRRAEIIDQRRKIFRPKNDYAAYVLEKNPPLDIHLFDDQLFAEFFKQHAQFFRTFVGSSISRNYRPETTARTDSRPRRSPTKGKAQTSRGSWRNHSGSMAAPREFTNRSRKMAAQSMTIQYPVHFREVACQATFQTG